MKIHTWVSGITAAVLISGSACAAAPQVFSGAGVSALIQINSYRNALDALDGRSEIAWDSVTLDDADGSTVIIPAKTVGIATNRYQDRGASFTQSIAVANDGFVAANPDIVGHFPSSPDNPPFTPFNIAAPINGSQVDVNFVIPSAINTVPVPAGTRGFGAIFYDVESADSTQIEYFNGSTSLGSFSVEAAGELGTSFLGVIFDQPNVTKAVLTVGSDAIFTFDGTTVTSGGAEDLEQGKDLVALDNLIFGVPQPLGPAVIPLPPAASLGLVGLLSLGLFWFGCRRRFAGLSEVI